MLSLFLSMLLQLKKYKIIMDVFSYRIAQNDGKVKLWQIGNFKNLAGKTLANCNKLS